MYNHSNQNSRDFRNARSGMLSAPTHNFWKDDRQHFLKLRDFDLELPDGPGYDKFVIEKKLQRFRFRKILDERKSGLSFGPSGRGGLTSWNS